MVMGELPERTQVLVVGGGPGGYAAAFRAADLGLEVTVVSDDERLGGVCLLRGCIPSKALLEVAHLVDRSREASRYGVDLGAPAVDLDTLRGWKDELVGGLSDGLATIARRRGVRVVHGRATFESSSRVRVSDGDEAGSLAFEHAVVATGSQPVALPDAAFGERVMDSAAALALPEVPARLLVVGGGYVGLEMGTVYAALGSAVTVVEMTDRLVPPVDGDLAEPLARHLEGRFEAFHFHTRVAELVDDGDGVRAVLDGDGDRREQRYDRALVAVGRRPRTADLGLDATSAKLDDQGFVVVDERRRSTDPRIFAIGDAAGGSLLAHEAMHEGRVAAEAVSGRPAAFDPRAVPAVVYTDPQIAWCGLTSQAAAEQGRDVEVTRYPWRASGRALTMGAPDGLTKLLTDPDSGRLLGVGIVGRDAESLIGEAVLALEMGAVAEDLACRSRPTRRCRRPCTKPPTCCWGTRSISRPRAPLDGVAPDQEGQGAPLSGDVGMHCGQALVEGRRPAAVMAGQGRACPRQQAVALSGACHPKAQQR